MTENSDAKLSEPCLLVIFGATGDLTHRKLVPALYHLHRKGVLPENFAVVGVARKPKDHKQFRDELVKNLTEVLEKKPVGARHFSEMFSYHQTEFSDKEGFQKLRTFLGELDQNHHTNKNIVYYLATAPDFFAEIVHQLDLQKLGKGKDSPGWQRVVFEKPFGHDLKSSQDLNNTIRHIFQEKEIFRIDHYLGKEAVQNLLVLRFANSLFEPLWNNHYIDHVQITASEELGVGRRGVYYEKFGALRDMVQNHLLQMMMLIAMEPPSTLDPEMIHNEKVKVLQSVPIPTSGFITKNVVKGQYTKGLIHGEAAKGFREENNVSRQSQTETFVALKLAVHNWRWQGVPFYLRTGKRLRHRSADITIQFKSAPSVLFHEISNIEQNSLKISIQPEEGVALRFNIKSPEKAFHIQPVDMEFCHSCLLGPDTPEAYERLLHDVIAGDNTLFTRWDELERSWMITDPILHAKTPTIPYDAGTWGPKQADDLIKRDGREWVNGQ